MVDEMQDKTVSFCYRTGVVSATENGTAAGFVRQLSQGTISNCFTVGTVKAENGTAVGFAGSITQYNAFVSNSYTAVQLTGAQRRGFTPSVVSSSGCYWVKQLGFNEDVDSTANVAGQVTSISFASLKDLKTMAGGWSWDSGDQSWTLATTPQRTHPVSDALKGMPYPYPRIKGLEYYGDWPTG
jgi:hypothetical protein